MRRSNLFLLALALSLGATPVSAHFPVKLKESDNAVEKGPILLDGTISFAVYADFKKAKEKRSFRLALKQGQELNVEYLILDQAPSNKLKKALLPSITITNPKGEKISMAISERTSFYEPYGMKNYFFLSRLTQAGITGIYSITAVAKAKSAIVIAIGRTETRGEFIEVGSKVGSCPITLKAEQIISEARANQLLTMSELGGETCARANGWIYRVGQRDNQEFMLTQDYSQNRVTVSIQSGVITKVSVG